MPQIYTLYLRKNIRSTLDARIKFLECYSKAILRPASIKSIAIPIFMN